MGACIEPLGVSRADSNADPGARDELKAPKLSTLMHNKVKVSILCVQGKGILLHLKVKVFGYAVQS